MHRSAYFAGGCFWCTEHDLRSLPGVLEVESGYVGEGSTATYENHNGFREGVFVLFDDEQTSFKKLCQFFLDHIDPTDEGGQFFDRGESYKTAIYFESVAEKQIAEGLIKELEDSKLYEKSIKTEVLPFTNFIKAEEYHQRYSEKNPEHYNAYRRGSGKEVWANKVCEIREQKKINWKE